MKFLFLYLFLFSINTIFSQSILKVDSLVEEIRRLQVKESSFYESGQFPSQRGKHKREDNNCFFSALISFTLSEISECAEKPVKNKMDSICSDIRATYSRYQNPSNGITYNFWKTKPPLFFPNSRFLSSHSRFQIPDDADCTSLIYLTGSGLKSDSALQHSLTQHANKSKCRIKNTFRKYRNFKAYSTWFGKKMPIEFDICVQSNVLYFIVNHHLPFSSQDSATVQLIKEQILSGDYLRYAYYISPSYKKRAIILYHLARLLEKNTIPQLERCRHIVKMDIEKEILKNKEYMDQVILSTALMRMNGNPPFITENKIKKNALDDYAFFRADLFSSYARPYLRFISRTRFFDCNFYCRAYCLALLTEYQLIRNRNTTLNR